MPKTRKHPNGTIGLRVFAWSAGNGLPYQDARNQHQADIFGLPIVAVNTISEGKDSPDLTLEQETDVDAGESRSVGRPMLEAGIRAYEENHEKVNQIILLADSQGPSMTPGIIEALPENIDLSHVIWVTPAGTREAGPTRELWTGMARTILPGQNMNAYRSRNPNGFKGLADTNLAKSILTQRDAHLKHYPRMMASGRLVGATRSALSVRDVQPQVHILSAEHDLVSPPKANQEAAARLDARLHELHGHYHTVEEYIGFIARLLAEILDVEVPTVSQSR